MKHYLLQTTRACLCAIAGLALLGDAYGETEQAEPQVTPVPYSSWSFYVEAITLDEQKAQEKGVGKDGHAIGFDYNRGFAKYFQWNIAIALILVDDKDKFSQTVENQFGGNRHEADSSIDSGYIGGGLGYAYTKERFRAGLDIGIRYLDMKRMIGNCSDCASEGIISDWSNFYRPFISYRFGQSFGIGLALTSYDNELITDSADLHVQFEM